jgi:hypothetical protein
VVYLLRDIGNGTQTDTRLIGTGFLVTVPGIRVPSGKHVFMVTARHVAEQLSLGRWLMRVNTLDGRTRDVTVKSKWWLHPTEEESVDAAVAYVDLDLPHDVLQANVIPENRFLTDSDITNYGVGAGDEVYITGLFTKAPGRSKNLPIVRTGNVALLPEPSERISGIEICNKLVDAEVYLVESRSIGGLSGSPAFVRATAHEKRNVALASGEIRELPCSYLSDFFLLGLTKGHWNVMADESNEVSIRAVGKKAGGVSLGIAVVVPAKKIKEILNQKEITELKVRIEEMAIHIGSQ